MRTERGKKTWGRDFQAHFMNYVSQPPFLLSTNKESTVYKSQGSPHLSTLLGCAQEPLLQEGEDEHKHELVMKRCKNKKEEDIFGSHSGRRKHFILVQALRQGFFMGALGCLCIGTGFAFTGLYATQHLETEIEEANHTPSLGETNGSLQSFLALDRKSRKAFEDITNNVGKLSIQGAVEPDVPHLVHDKKGNGLDESVSLGIKTSQSNLDPITDSFSGKVDVNGSKPKGLAYTNPDAWSASSQDFLLAVDIVHSSTSWWISVACFTLGFVMLAQSMITLLGEWMECKS